MKKINPAARTKKNSHKNFDATGKVEKTTAFNEIVTLSDYFSARTISTANTASTSTTNTFNSGDF